LHRAICIKVQDIFIKSIHISVLVFFKYEHDGTKTVKAHVFHSDLYKKLQTLQLWKTINTGIYN